MLNPITGTIYVVTDITVASTARQMPLTRVITLSEDPEYTIALPDAVRGTVFLPPYESMMFLSDSDYINFREVYMNYLINSAEANLFLSIITKSVLIQGNNIVIFVPREEAELGFFQVFSEYLINFYGIAVGTDQNPFMYNFSYDGSNCERMYLNGFMTVDELMVNFPPVTLFSLPVVEKLAAEMGQLIPLHNASIDEISQWLFSYKERIKQNNNVFLQRGIIKYDSVR